MSREDGGGYYRPTIDDKNEVEKFIKQENCRALTTLGGLTTAKNFLRKLEWEGKLNEYKKRTDKGGMMNWQTKRNTSGCD